MNRYAWQLIFLLLLLVAIGAGKNLAKAGSPITATGSTTTSAASGSSGVLGLAAVQTACIQNFDLRNWLTFDTVSGAYTFTGCTPGQFNLSGTGTVRIVGGVAFLTDNKPDRRVSAFFNLSQGTGHATVSVLIAPGTFQTLSINGVFGAPCTC